MIYKTFSYWLWFASFGILALVFANVPLFDILAFEFCAVVTLGIAVAGVHVAITTLQAMKRAPDALVGPPGHIVLRCFWRALVANMLLLLIALGIILLNAFRVKNCNFGEGFLFFLILPTLSCGTATAAGILFGLWIERRWLAYLTYIGFLLLSCMPVLINLIFHPPVFAYHAMLGYFPGPIYDFVVPITPTLLLARAETVIWTCLLLSLAINACEINRETGLLPRLRWRNLLAHIPIADFPKRAVLCLLILVLGGFQLYAGKLGTRLSRGDIERELGGYHETANFEIFYARELEGEIQRIANDCEFQYSQLSTYFGTEISRKVRAYIYSSTEQKKRLIGAGDTSVEDPFGYGFHIHAQGQRHLVITHPVLKHELAHVLTADWSPWKFSLSIGLHEGIAVAADWSEGRLTGHQWAKAMHELKVAPPLSGIMGIGLGFWGHSGARSYLLTGSFVRFIVDTYGIEKLISIFPTGNFAKGYGKSLETLETEWLEFLKNVPLKDEDLRYATNRLKRRGIFERVCAHEIAALRDNAWDAYSERDFDTAVKMFERMLSAEPENSIHLRGLMFSEYQRGNYERAAALAKRIGTDENAFYRAEAVQLLGDIQWLQGTPEEAFVTYTEAMSLAPRETIERGIIKRRLALSKTRPPESRENLRRVLISGDPTTRIGSGAKMELLQRVIEAEPEEGLAYLLAGELLHKEGAWQLSTKYLRQAVTVGKTEMLKRIAPQLALEARRLIGINSYHQEAYEIAEDVFSAIAADTALPLGTVLSAQEWIQRCRWARKM